MVAVRNGSTDVNISPDLIPEDSMPALSVGNQWSWRKKGGTKKGGNFTVFWRGRRWVVQFLRARTKKSGK